jgi:hypothetical protein
MEQVKVGRQEQRRRRARAARLLPGGVRRRMPIQRWPCGRGSSRRSASARLDTHLLAVSVSTLHLHLEGVRSLLGLFSIESSKSRLSYTSVAIICVSPVMPVTPADPRCTGGIEAPDSTSASNGTAAGAQVVFAHRKRLHLQQTATSGSTS